MQYLIMVQSNPTSLAHWETLSDAEQRGVRPRALRPDRRAARLRAPRHLGGPGAGRDGHPGERARRCRGHRRPVRRGQGAPGRASTSWSARTWTRPWPSRRGCPTPSSTTSRCGRCSTAACSTTDRCPRDRRLLRELRPGVLATLARQHRAFDVCEDAVQEALLAAATQWPADGVPDNPKGWLVTAASRRWIETWRRTARGGGARTPGRGAAAARRRAERAATTR